MSCGLSYAYLPTRIVLLLLLLTIPLVLVGGAAAAGGADAATAVDAVVTYCCCCHCCCCLHCCRYRWSLVSGTLLLLPLRDNRARGISRFALPGELPGYSMYPRDTIA